MLPFAMYCLIFFDISAIDHGFCMVFGDAWIVSPSKYNYSNSLLCHSSNRHSNASWLSFHLEFLEGFYNNKLGISITPLNEILFNGEPWIHEPEGKRKRFLWQKTTLLFIMSMVFDKMVFPVCDQEYLIAREAVVSLLLLVDGILCSLLSDGLFLSLHLPLRRFSLVLYVLLQYWHIKCSLDRKFWLLLLTG